MRQSFGYYYSPSAEIDSNGLWASGVFVLDSNVLLNIYQYPPTTQRRWVETLELMADKLWIPHQVGLEYHNTLGKKVKEVEAESTAIFLKPFSDCLAALKMGEHALSDANGAAELFNTLKSNVDTLNRSAKEIVATWKRKFALEWKNLKETIADLIPEDKVGREYSVEKMKEISAKGEQRYKLNIPPGFKDSKKKEGNPFGDLIIWLQLIDKAQECRKPIIFVTQDRKEDWTKENAPRPELIREMLQEAGVSFYIYEPAEFLSFVDKILDRNPDAQAIIDTKAAQAVGTENNNGPILVHQRYGPSHDVAFEVPTNPMAPYLVGFPSTIGPPFGYVPTNESGMAIYNLSARYPRWIMDDAKDASKRSPEDDDCS